MSSAVAYNLVRQLAFVPGSLPRHFLVLYGMCVRISQSASHITELTTVFPLTSLLFLSQNQIWQYLCAISFYLCNGSAYIDELCMAGSIGQVLHWMMACGHLSCSIM